MTGPTTAPSGLDASGSSRRIAAAVSAATAAIPAHPLTRCTVSRASGKTSQAKVGDPASSTTHSAVRPASQASPRGRDQRRPRTAPKRYQAASATAAAAAHGVQRACSVA